MSILFTPIEINGMTVPHRIMRSATCGRCAEVSGHVTDRFVRVHEELAAGGAGLIVTGHAYVKWNGKASVNMLGAHQDDLIPGLKRVTEAVHRYDCKIVMQLNHAGTRTSTAITGEPTVAPSSVYNSLYNETPRAFTSEEIEELIEAYGAAAGRALSAGFDGVQIHGAHGYLVSQFMSPLTNQRKDKWGGSLENRMRFPLELLRQIRKKVGENYPVMIKLNAEDFLEGGITVKESAQIAKALCNEGIDAIEISGGMQESREHIIKTDILTETDEAYYRDNAKKLKAAINVPMMLVGGMRSPNLMEKMITGGEVDMVSLCRPFIREPGLVNRWKQGNREKAHCISCNGCLEYQDEPTRCVLVD